MIRRPRSSALFPYTTLFRSAGEREANVCHGGAVQRRGADHRLYPIPGGREPTPPTAQGPVAAWFFRQRVGRARHQRAAATELPHHLHPPAARADGDPPPRGP